MENGMNEPKKVRWNVLAAIDYVCKQTEYKKLKYEETPQMKKTLERLCSYFGGINENQVIILSAVLSLDLSHAKRTNINISAFFGMTVFSYLQHNNEIEDLDERSLLEVEINEEGHSYDIPQSVVTSILRNSEISIEKNEFDPVDFVKEVTRILDNNMYDHIRKNKEKAYKLETKNLKQTFIKQVKALVPIPSDRSCFYAICSDFVDGFDTNLQHGFRRVYDNNATSKIKSMLSEKHVLLKCGLVDFVIKGNVIDSTLTLTDKAKKIFLGENEYLYERKLNEKSLIPPSSIVSKHLFYSPENQKQIDTLYSAIESKNLLSIQNGLRSKGLPTGICILLYGAPGTGKTESVYQIAKATNRQIIHVDISTTKSCWFGESEKLIEQIFVDYKKSCQKLKAGGNTDVPILLFNEADAVLQKRTEFRGGGVEKIENAMQNILLENMEKFEGILIATTNLVINLDAAFERRFLFKIKFDNPSVEAKTAIWRSKLEWLPENQAQLLANEYNFSGGEIDNVVRKATMEEILTGSRVTINRLEEICNTEKLNNSNCSNKVGFRA